ncbi:MAG TPA: dynamin family protein [Kofleriaceae bacterium]|nr:dynamin family protein [Kofleriaceae bacterium]
MSLWSRLERRINDLADGLVLDEHRDQVSQARSLVAAGQTQPAIELLQALLVVKPDHGQALTVLGSAYLDALDPAQRNPGEAVKAFERALAVRPGDPTALLGLGLAQVALAQPDTAIATLARAVHEAAGDRAVLANAYRGLGIAWRRKGELDKAVRELRKAVAEDSGDRDARAALGEALVADHAQSEEARRHLERAVADSKAATTGATDAPPIAYFALGQLALREQAPALATNLFDQARALATRDTTPLGRTLLADILLGQGAAALALRDPMRAHTCFLEALQLEPKRADIHASIATAHRAVGNRDAALASYDRALSLAAEPTAADMHEAGNTANHAQPSLGMLRDAVDAAIALGDATRQLQWSADLLVRDPDNTRALVARGLGAAANGDVGTAHALLNLAVGRGDLDAHVGLARLKVRTGVGNESGARAPETEQALALLTNALRIDPRYPAAREALTQLLRATYPQPTSTDINHLAALLESVLAQRADLASLVGETARATAGLDSPLLVTVMGEFSSGKSSFVNAFIGGDVAPTGITPTTATINVVKYGHERRGQIFYADATRTPLSLPWAELFGHLRQLSADAARAIDRVEIAVPLPQLEKINIVDTPGLNSILPEHEATARAFIARADAVVWVFTANQGGKSSERKALQSIRNEGKRVLGVLNKADQLSSSEIAEVRDFIGTSLGELVETIVPFSARSALAHKQSSNADALPVADAASSVAADGNWTLLQAELEQRFFSQARQLKRQACARRLRVVISDAKSRITSGHADFVRIADEARSLSSTLTAAIADLESTLIVTQRKSIVDATTALFRRAAREVIDLVRPRRLPFSAHSATVADRDYLIALLEAGFLAMFDESQRQVVAELNRRIEPVIAQTQGLSALLDADIAGDLHRLVDSQLALATAQVYDRSTAYLRGFLAGGYIESFFRNDVPKLELNVDAVFHALFRGAPDLDRQLGEPLAAASTNVIRAVATRIAYWGEVANGRVFVLEAGILRALDEIGEALDA